MVLDDGVELDNQLGVVGVELVGLRQAVDYPGCVGLVGRVVEGVVERHLVKLLYAFIIGQLDL